MINRFKEYRPVFLSADRERSLAYYAMLGFQCNHYTGFVDRDGLRFAVHDASGAAGEIRPNHRVDGRSWDMYIWVEDADALYAELSAKGAMIHYPPHSPREYHMREFAILDPDGYIFAFGSPIR
ncbi:VOC family protein [Paenibacillus sp. S-38]|uniref:VOC family protein n=1 Tax=Paenibacillus sp. S-38 TaxID=3416710 RepID=UPI003CEF46C0